MNAIVSCIQPVLTNLLLLLKYYYYKSKGCGNEPHFQAPVVLHYVIQQLSCIASHALIYHVPS
jgi:hypothetical protein